MNASEFFPTRPPAKPTIYAFASTRTRVPLVQDRSWRLLKVGYTEGDPLKRSVEVLAIGLKGCSLWDTLQ